MSKIKDRSFRYFLYQNNRSYLVQVARLELAASCSQSRRATNCATPGNINKWNYTPCCGKMQSEFAIFVWRCSMHYKTASFRAKRSVVEKSTHESDSCMRIGAKIPVAVPGECPRWRGTFVPRRPLPLAQVASSATGGAPIAPPRPGAG